MDAVGDRARGGTAHSVMVGPLKRYWAYPAALGCLLVGLACGESVYWRVFWPDFLVVMSLGLLLSSLFGEVNQARADTAA